MNGTDDYNVAVLDATWPDLPSFASIVDMLRVWFANLEGNAQYKVCYYYMVLEDGPEGKHLQFARPEQRT